MKSETVSIIGGTSGVITWDAATYHGVVLDRMVETGPRGGKSVLWRAASKRDYQVASWSHTREDAAK
jgi:hypothetical protein